MLTFYRLCGVVVVQRLLSHYLTCVHKLSCVKLHCVSCFSWNCVVLFSEVFFCAAAYFHVYACAVTKGIVGAMSLHLYLFLFCFVVLHSVCLRQGVDCTKFCTRKACTI